MWSPPQPPLKTPVVATSGVSVAGPSSLSSNGTGLHPRSPPRGPRSLWNGAASTAGASTLVNTNPSAATPTATTTSNGTPLFPENPSGPPTATTSAQAVHEGARTHAGSSSTSSSPTCASSTSHVAWYGYERPVEVLFTR
ncbi:hypothetical protein D9613_012795 [Agrocybe pediades]|uniref:Uncharacterized protein n=1 Tax=Agrocybe pediades TaxID=84607 RepID=A0A8H4R3I7_9AGAR|nr:hypothetical protein D9613_012795 [Agrocybe pediades]